MRLTLGIAVLLVAAQVKAENEKFYPIVGADGSVQIIKSPVDEAITSKVRKTKKVKSKAGLGTAPEQKQEAKPATYDSDEYANSEALEGARDGSPNKGRFYIINDEFGSQVNEGEAVLGTQDIDSPVVMIEPVQRPFRIVDENIQTLSGGEALVELPELPSCLAKKDMDGAKGIMPGVPESVVLGKKTYSFLKAPGVLASYQIGGNGLRSITSSSFSRTDRRPGFVHPYLAFFNGQGCLTRVIKNFYESLYPATERRHPMLKASLTVHAEESFMLVIVPQAVQLKSVSSLPYEYSPYGQLKFTVKKQ